MGVRIVHVDLPEPGHLLRELPVREKSMTVLNDVRLEGDFRAWKQAHRHGRFSDCGETASDRVVELRRYQLVSDLRGSRGDEVLSLPKTQSI
jgi:hypothetical protein